MQAVPQQKDVATCALGLAVLASFCKVPELVALEETIEKVPLLAKVCALYWQFYPSRSIPRRFEPGSWSCDFCWHSLLLASCDICNGLREILESGDVLAERGGGGVCSAANIANQKLCCIKG